MSEAILKRSALEEVLFKAINADLGETRVLVVEDDDAMRAFLEESLREEGYVVRTACNTLSAIVNLIGDRPDVLVIDWKMPDLDGLELLGSTRRCFPNIPVILVSAFASPDLRRQALQEGAFTFLAKPFGRDELLSQVRAALSSIPPKRTRP